MIEQSLAGTWEVVLPDASVHTMQIPGTLDENQIGYPDSAKSQLYAEANRPFTDGPIATRFTRRYTFEGEAKLSKTVTLAPLSGKRRFLEVERARCLRLLADDVEIPPFEEPTLSSPHCFEITSLTPGEHTITFLSDNSYPGLPHDDIVYSSAATDETQTNWNGLLGYVRITTEEAVFLNRVSVYPHGDTVTIKAEVDAAIPYEGTLTFTSDVLTEVVHLPLSMNAGRQEFSVENLPIKPGAARWDEEEGNLYTLTASLQGAGKKTVTFGIRTFADNGSGRFALNGRTLFLRGESNCAAFPETGYCPMSEEEWTHILTLYRSYGVNCVRFHSHCPPEAAFAAADRLGMLMQPELSQWNPYTAFLSEESFSYYQTELRRILQTLANHPSFVMLTLGNELHTSEEGHRRMDELLDMARAIDPTRRYARGSNEHYGVIGCGENTDFYTAMRYFSEDLRGTFNGAEDVPGGIQGYINRQYPNAKTDYRAAMQTLRERYQKPVYSFEVGQFEVLPDFDELEKFHGISDPQNYRLIRDKVKARGLLPVWKRMVEATGELSRIGYREEVEAAMRTEELSGIFLLGLQDFPGQGTALVGMLDSHLEPKPFPFAKPEAFSAFFRSVLPLVLLEKYTYTAKETLCAPVKLANYGKQPLAGALHYTLFDGKTSVSGTLKEVCCPAGTTTDAGTITLPLTGYDRPTALTLTVELDGAKNSYPIWVYPDVSPVCPASVWECRRLDDKALSVLEQGGTVYLAPDSTKEQLPHSIQAQFTTDFWSVGTFKGQEGGMGQLIDSAHPLFEHFPTEFYTNWQWWPMATQRAVILPRECDCIVTELDSYAFLRPMAQLLECRCGNGKLLLSTFGLHDLLQYPEARALQHAIYTYLDSDRFAPAQELTVEELQYMVR